MSTEALLKTIMDQQENTHTDIFHSAFSPNLYRRKRTLKNVGVRVLLLIQNSIGLHWVIMIDQLKPRIAPLLSQTFCKHKSHHTIKESAVASALLHLNHNPVAIATGNSLEDFVFDEILEDECNCIVWVKGQPQTTWYIYEEDWAPTWRLWGEEKCEGAIHTVYLKKVRYHHPSRSIAQESDDDEISHLEWETVRVRFLKAGTLEKLIESLTSDTGELESSFVNVFLATYRTFATTSQVLNRMLDRYAAFAKAKPNSVCLGIPSPLYEFHKKAIRLTLQVWMDTYIDDFKDPPLFSCMHQILDFAKEFLPDSDLLIKVNYKLEKLKKEEDKKNSPLLERILSLEDLTISCSPSLSNGVSHSNISLQAPFDFVHIPEYIFAQQLTRMDAVLFQKLIPHQCLGSVWSQRDKSKANGSPTVVATIEQFNAVIYRVQSTVLVDTDLKPSQRARLITKWIDVAQELRMLKNFSSLKAIISSLQSNPIYRLRKTWTSVGKEKFELYVELARIFSEENNKLNQRELLMKEGTAKHAQTAHADDRHLPKAIEKLSNNPLAVNHGTIPYMGTFLTDLTMIDTAIPDTIDSGLINFDKKRKEFEVLAQIRLLQGAANAYQIEADDRFERWWDSVLVLDGKEVFDLSCQIEPEGNSAPSSVKSSKSKSSGHCKSNSIGENSIVSSNDSFIIGQNESYLTERKLSTSSNSSLPSMNISVNSSGGASIPPSTPEKTHRLSLNNNNQGDDTLMNSISPYINQDFYIIKVSIESGAHEIQGVNLYKSIYLNNSERTLSVIEKAMSKHDIEGDPKDYTLAQLLPEGEMVLPQSANVYYAIKLSQELKFVLRRRRHGDENSTIRRNNPNKDHKVRKKLLPLKAY